MELAYLIWHKNNLNLLLRIKTKPNFAQNNLTYDSKNLN